MTNFDEDFESGAFELENVVANPELVAAALKMNEEQDPPELKDPLDGPVTLPAGFRRVTSVGGTPEFEEVRKAWVRELNGEDEERIARARMKDDPSAFLQTILEQGVERLGDQKPSREDLTALVLGDREYLLMEIARVTYGDELEYEKVPCPGCGEQVDVELSIADDIPVKRLGEGEERNFKVNLKRGRVASVSLPTGEIAADMSKAESPAEANTVLIAHCVNEIQNPDETVTPIRGDKDAAKRLGIVDRRTLVNAMSDRMPGPQYNEVRFNHEPGCGEEIRLNIQLADLFLGL